MAKHKVAVLMASYNGITWLPDQIKSILSQLNVDISLFISDDFSQDGSYGYLQQSALSDSRIQLMPQTEKFGTAGNNFYRLIQDVNITNYDYVAFADQDDIWHQDKLIRHIELIQKHGADGVSSNVIAFWTDGDKKLISKSNPQKKWDFLFESAGPGCTFLLTPWLVNKVRDQLISPKSLAKKVVLHDWLTYAICRAHGHKWVIDATPSMLYRQHCNNVLGANIGLKAKLARLKKLKQGWYRTEVIKIAEVVSLISQKSELMKIRELLIKKNLVSQIKLLTYVSQARRNFLDQAILFVLIAFYLF